MDIDQAELMSDWELDVAWGNMWHMREHMTLEGFPGVAQWADSVLVGLTAERKRRIAARDDARGDAT